MELDSIKAIRASFETQPFVPFHSLSIYRDNSFLNQRLAAICSSTHVIVVRIDNEISEIFPLSIKSGGNQSFTLTDIAWNPYDPGRIAVCTTSGMVSVFGCDFSSAPIQMLSQSTPSQSLSSSYSPSQSHSYPKSITSSPSLGLPSSLSGAGSVQSISGYYPIQSNSLQNHNNTNQGTLPPSSSIIRKQEWDSGENISRAVHRVAWSKQDSSMLATACQDGHVRLFDTRTSRKSLDFTLRSIDSIRDLQFDPFSSCNLFASLSENGTCCIWDPRYPGDNVVYKYLAHGSGGALALAYHPTAPSYLATGAKDKLCKIWSINTLMNSDTSSTSISKPIHTIKTLASVGRIRWRGLSNHIDEVATSSPDRGEISIWSLRKPLVPGCVLRGHSDCCGDFDWIDTPLSSQSSTPVQSDTCDSPTPLTKQDAPLCNKFLELNQHILSVGKDGKLLIQDLRNGYFPRRHIASSVTAISSTGNVAYQRGDIDRTDILGLKTGKVTSRVPLPFTDKPSAFGSDFPSNLPDELSNSVTRGASAATTADDPANRSTPLSAVSGNPELTIATSQSHLLFPMDSSVKSFSPVFLHPSKIMFKSDKLTLENIGASTASETPTTSGCIFVGLASISSLVAAKEINSQHAAEGGVFDPATIKLLAVSYKIRGGVNACKENIRIAKDAGLIYRSAAWTSLLAILHYSPGLADSAAPDIGASASKSMPTLHSSAAAIIGDSLKEFIDCGDCLHFVSFCELVAEFSESLMVKCLEIASISSLRQNEAYYSYISLLHKMRLFSEANYITKMTKINSAVPSSGGINLHMYCETCGKEIPDNDSISYCPKCNKGGGLCMLCHKPVRGLYRWCPICAHGGHNVCLNRWFNQSTCCPTGCGHNCTFDLCSTTSDNNHYPQSVGSVSKTPLSYHQRRRLKKRQQNL